MLLAVVVQWTILLRRWLVVFWFAKREEPPARLPPSFVKYWWHD